MIKKITVLTCVISAVVIATALFLYTYGIPYLLTNNKILDYTSSFLQKNFSTELELKNPKIVTDLKSGVIISADELVLKSKDKMPLLRLSKFDTKFYLKDLLILQVRPEYINSEDIFIDLSGIIKTFCSKPLPAGNRSFKIRVFDTDFDIKNLVLLYDIAKKHDFKLTVDNFVIKDGKINFTSDTVICGIDLKTSDKGNLYIKDGKLYIENYVITHKKEKIILSGQSEDFVENSKFNYAISIIGKGISFNEFKSDNFERLDGYVDIDLKINPKDILGGLKFKDIFIKDTITGISVVIPQFETGFNSRRFKINKINGYFCDYPKNKFDIELTVDNYLKEKWSYNGVVNIDFTSDFAKNFLTKKLGYPMGITGVPKSRLVFKGDYKKLDLTALYKMEAGDDFVIDGRGLGLADHERVMVTKIEADAKKVVLKSLDYFITFIDKEKKEHRVSIITLSGDWFITQKGLILNTVGFKINKFIPAEFFNAITKQKTFRRGVIKGEMKIDNRGVYPKVKGALTLEKVRIPAERIFIKAMSFTADERYIKIVTDGRYKKSAFEFKGIIDNKLVYPLNVKQADLTIDKIDVKKMLSNRNESRDIQAHTPDEAGETGDNVVAFDIGNIIVENSTVSIKEGKYKEIDFGNLKANATLDKASFFELTSNRFDIADGHSGLKFSGNLKDNIFDLKLGARGVNSQKLASAFFGLKDDITGKADGMIILTLDNNTGFISGNTIFKVKDGKMFLLGFSEYVMRAVNMFRNPFLSLNLNNIIGLLKDEDGSFKSVVGDIVIKDNVITEMNIKTQSDTMATYITGKYGLTDFDADLRIFTKFAKNNKTLLGKLGSLSLNSVSDYIPLDSNNEYALYKALILSIPDISVEDKDTSVYMIKVDGDIGSENYLSSVKKVK